VLGVNSMPTNLNNLPKSVEEPVVPVTDNIFWHPMKSEYLSEE
jgi:hypothetical protein